MTTSPCTVTYPQISRRSELYFDFDFTARRLKDLAKVIYKEIDHPKNRHKKISYLPKPDSPWIQEGIVRLSQLFGRTPSVDSAQSNGMLTQAEIDSLNSQAKSQLDPRYSSSLETALRVLENLSSSKGPSSSDVQEASRLFNIYATTYPKILSLTIS